MPLAKSYIHRLPFSGRFFCSCHRFDAAVNSAHIMRIKLFLIGIHNLYLVHSAQINTAVISGRNVYLQFQVEILKLVYSSQISVTYMR